jgi:fumarate reductase subunit D
MTARSHKPIVWGLFAAGGTIAAFCTPAMVAVTLLFPLPYHQAVDFVHNWIGKILLFGIIGLQTWHAAHRLRITAHDLGLRADATVAFTVYSLASLLTLATALYLARI